MPTLPGKPVRASLNWPWIDVVAIGLAIVAMRILIVGNPVVHVDEQFYLLVGGRMLDGALPYVDIWDRKPIGLFLIYAFAALFGDGVVAYQMLAMLAAVATGLIVYRMARIYADRPTAVLSAISYAVFLNLLEGGGGQSPVFYNLPVTAAVAIAMTLFVRRDEVATGRLMRDGMLAMLLMGIAIQIKYSVVGEAICCGLFLQWLMLRRQGVLAAAAGGLVWAAIALAPTGLAWLYYAVRGAADAFLYANFLSIGTRGGDPAGVIAGRFAEILKILAGPVSIGLVALWLGRRGDNGRKLGDGQRFILLWNGAAWLSFLAFGMSFGTFFPHYALPLAAPTALVFAFASGRWLAVRALIMVAGAGAGIDTVRHDVGREGGGAMVDAILTRMRQEPPRNCPYVYEGPSILYHLGPYCLPTRHPFPYHLNITREHDALGIDGDTELNRIMALNPAYVVLRWPFSAEHRKKSDAIVMRALAQRYRLVDRVPQWNIYSMHVYALKPGLTQYRNDKLPPEPVRSR